MQGDVVYVEGEDLQPLFPLASVIKYLDLEMTWNSEVCKLTLPCGKEIHLPREGGSIFIFEDDAQVLLEMKAKLRNKRVRALAAALATRLRDAAKLREHAAGGHIEFDPACPGCRGAHGRMRPHRRLDVRTRLGGQLSVDISGPHLPGKWPSGRQEDAHRKACLLYTSDAADD